MKFGFFFPNFNIFGNPNLCLKLAQEVEKAGWDGFFLWDHILHLNRSREMVDTWVMLSAIAVRTHKIHFGPLITPLSRRRPWKVAREAATLDQLSNGRFILGVGLGAPKSTDFKIFGEVDDDRIRAERLNESLEIITGLWTGKPFEFQGKHFQIKSSVTFLPTPVQRPRVRIWVGGKWPRKPPFRRAAMFDGIIPEGSKGKDRAYSEIMQYIKQYRNSDKPFDLVHYGALPKRDHAISEKVEHFENIGVTWWLIPEVNYKVSFEEQVQEIGLGPPNL